MDVLIVDDSKLMRFALARILRQLGCITIHEAGDGLEALELLRRIPCPHLALVDWNMPVFDGIEFVRAVRADPTLVGLRLLMVTTEGGPQREAEAAAAGVDGYVLKPFTTERLHAAILALGLLPPA